MKFFSFIFFGSVFVMIWSASAGPTLRAENSEILFSIGNIQVATAMGDLTKVNMEAVAFAGGRTSHGGELTVGYKLAEAGAQKGFEELDKLFSAQRPLGGFEFGSAQIVPSGGGSYRYLINAVTQGSKLVGYEAVENDPRFARMSDEDLKSVPSILTHVNERRLVTLATKRAMETAKFGEYKISEIAMPFFGTGSFHQMHPGLSLVSMLAGIEEFVAAHPNETMKIRIVYYGRPGPEATDALQRYFVPTIEAGFHKPENYDKFVQRFWDDPIAADKEFSNFFSKNKPMKTNAASASTSRRSPLQFIKDCGTGLKRTVFDFFDDLLP